MTSDLNSIPPCILIATNDITWQSTTGRVHTIWEDKVCHNNCVHNNFVHMTRLVFLWYGILTWRISNTNWSCNYMMASSNENISALPVEIFVKNNGQGIIKDCNKENRIRDLHHRYLIQVLFKLKSSKQFVNNFNHSNNIRESLRQSVEINFINIIV